MFQDFLISFHVHMCLKLAKKKDIDYLGSNSTAHIY
jgi:hypothetical protein